RTCPPSMSTFFDQAREEVALAPRAHPIPATEEVGRPRPRPRRVDGLELKNFVQHKLTVQPLAGDTVLTWDSVSGWPTVGDFPIRLDSVDLLTTEQVLCTSVNVGANQTTVVRAQEGTSASGLFVINSTGGNDLTAQMLTDAM